MANYSPKGPRVYITWRSEGPTNCIKIMATSFQRWSLLVGDWEVDGVLTKLKATWTAPVMPPPRTTTTTSEHHRHHHSAPVATPFWWGQTDRRARHSDRPVRQTAWRLAVSDWEWGRRGEHQDPRGGFLLLLLRPPARPPCALRKSAQWHPIQEATGAGSVLYAGML